MARVTLLPASHLYYLPWYWSPSLATVSALTSLKLPPLVLVISLGNGLCPYLSKITSLGTGHLPYFANYGHYFLFAVVISLGSDHMLPNSLVTVISPEPGRRHESDADKIPRVHK